MKNDLEDNQSTNKSDDVDRVLLIDLENCPS